ncbi:Tripartite-type tricarboxylate transporter, receptor component TctC [Cupriavidus sp. OV038]|jgi:tripartite-type tricarboxylate transporter receptor subunit TctC|uniref:Bug family tripartite tricarboxylate transporter substrate binding protein n=1 Tax=unclassified Cupriavidus TaxID=2640874 RepID=UPI0008EC1881|nr:MULTISPECIES: tripartite tricarboxylate transporter substrate binding protein [unclassified Cupriavidus]SFC14128.1 Tripartite-type tricarboxylate transporter, receptor component TctC [Cupriavidus sp. OV038]SFP09641.1 Tripartite-type tricarboxylate transporter, receptor component TctC [Cupriavidus sp. OV096]
MLRTLPALAGMAVALTLAAVGSAHADTYPSKPIQMIVPQAPGGTNDIVARLVAADLSQRLGQQVVVENRPGAGGNIGTQAAARATADGYTLLMTISSTQAINPSLYRQIPFDPIKDFEPIAPVATVPNVLVVNPAFPAKSMAELITMAKAKPDFYRYASAGNGTLNHLLGEMLNSMAGIKLEHVPYKGVAPALNDVLGNQVPMAFASLPSVLAHIKAGKVRALGVSSAKRSPFAPDIPAISETVPGYSGDLWVGLFAVRGTPKAVTEKLAKTLQAALADAPLRDKLAAQGAEVLIGTPQQFSTMLRADIDKWGKIVKASGAQVD